MQMEIRKWIGRVSGFAVLSVACVAGCTSDEVPKNKPAGDAAAQSDATPDRQATDSPAEGTADAVSPGREEDSKTRPQDVQAGREAPLGREPAGSRPKGRDQAELATGDVKQISDPPVDPPSPSNPAELSQHGRIAPVLLTEQHEQLCHVLVGDQMPDLAVQNFAGSQVQLSSLYGERATVVFFWESELLFARWELADLGPGIAAKYGDLGVQVVGINVGDLAEVAQQQISAAGATYPQLHDPSGEAFSKVGKEKLPRTYLLDASGKILWFDIEYSRSARRELRQAIWQLLADAS